MSYGYQTALGFLKERTELQPYLLERPMEVSPDLGYICEYHSAKNFTRWRYLESSGFGTCHWGSPDTEQDYALETVS